MSAYSTILIAIDLHGNPEQVLAKAATLAGESANNIHVLSVSPGPTDNIYANYPVSASSTANFNWEELLNDTQERMRNLVEQAGLHQAQIRAEYGRTTHVIIEQARLLESDLIIVGSHGRHGVGLLLGSTANGVLHRASCDVLAVRMTKENVGGQ